MRSSARLLVPLALICTLAGCATPTPEPTPTPTGFATEDEAFAAAEATYRAYVDASNQVDFSDPKTAEDVYAWLAGDALAASREEFSAASAEGWTRNGSAEIVSMAPHMVAPPYEAMTIDACVDISAVTVTDPSGDQVLPTEGIGIQSVRVSLARSSATSTGLSITALSPRQDGPSCVE